MHAIVIDDLRYVIASCYSYGGHIFVASESEKRFIDLDSAPFNLRVA